MDDLMAWLLQAQAQAASDVYLLPLDEDYAVYFRVAANFQRQQIVSSTDAIRWINNLKFSAGMNVAEHRRVQLGALRLPEAKLELRLSSVGDVNNRESLVVRLLYGIPALDAAAEQVVSRLLSIIQRRGMLALSGPTGSGKTTLLYQVAEQLAGSRMVMTIEDPVEILHAQFLQLQVNPAAEMTYAALLKAALRHRPDVLLIGELRDRETAQVACEAALSGHIVLTTVHARSAQLVPTRLIAMGVSQALVQAALTASAQVELVWTPQVHAEADLVVWRQAQGGAAT